MIASKEDIDKLVNSIVDYCSPAQIILFGSYAKNAAHENSDIDLMIIGENIHLFKNNLKYLFVDYPIPIDLHFFDEKDFEEYSKIKYSFPYCVKNFGVKVYHHITITKITY